MNQPVTVTEETLRRAAVILRSGGVVAFPTETYYGLAVDPLQRPALERLFGSNEDHGTCRFWFWWLTSGSSTCWLTRFQRCITV